MKSKKTCLFFPFRQMMVALFFILIPFFRSFAGETVKFQSDVFIKEWLVCGPFPYEKDQTIRTDFLQEQGGESGIVPAPGLTHKSSSVLGGTVTWQRSKADDSGKLDFKKYLHPNQKNVAYAAVFIQCDKKIPALLKIGSNDRVKVWLNGKLIHFYPRPRASGPDADQILVALQKGKNLLLAKVDQEGGNWWLYARFQELLPLTENIYITTPYVTSVPKRTDENSLADFFSVLACNISAEPAGPLYLKILSGKQRFGGVDTCKSIPPGQLIWLDVASKVKMTGTGNRIDADLIVSAGSSVQKFKIRKERGVSIDGMVYVIPGFHVDPVWRDSQSGYQVLSFSNVSQNLRAVQADSSYQLFLHEIPYLKPYYDEFPEARSLIRKLIREGRIATGGSYNQPNETTLSGEAFIRNILYGRLFHENVLGDYPRVYMPWDVFGHIIQLPQILAKSEFIGALFTRSNYREPGVRVPDLPDLYRAEAPDGSLLLMRKVDYGFDWGKELFNRSNEARTKIANLFKEQAEQIPGLGYDVRLDATDEKAPTAWMIGKCAEFATYVPKVKISAGGGEDYFRAVGKQISEKRLAVPEVSRDISQYNEGCELSRFDLKAGNRLAENMLISAEKFATIANLLGADYPADDLDKAWRQVLFGQHHDGITGCGADVPYLDLVASYHEALELSGDALQNALHFIGEQVNTQGEKKAVPLIIFNPLNWRRDDVVKQKLVFEQPVTGFQIVDDSGNPVPCVIDKLAKEGGKIISADVIFIARQIPSLGYRTFWVVPALSLPQTVRENKKTTREIENDFYRLTVSEQYGGGIVSLIDKSTGKEFINTGNGHPGNELILLKEGNGFEPAWRFITTGEKYFSKDMPARIDVFANPLFQRIVISGEMPGMKKRVQEITLYHHLRRIDFRTYFIDYKGLNGKNILESEPHNNRDFYLIGFPADLPGAVPVLEDRFATKTYYHSKNYLDYKSTSTEWTSHHAMNSCYQWFDYSYSVRLKFGDKNSIALGPVEILTPHNDKLRKTGFMLQKALAKRGVTATPGYDRVERDYDIQYRRFSFSIGTVAENEYSKKLLRRVSADQKEKFAQQLKNQGYAFLFMYDTQLKESWFDLPVLVISGVDENSVARAVAYLTAQLSETGDIHLSAESYAGGGKNTVPDYGMAILNHGNMPVSIEPDGTMVLALMHTVPWQSPLLQWTHDFPERKTHVFDYAVIPHSGNWRDAAIVRSGYEFNNPLLVLPVEQHRGKFPATHSFFTVAGENAVVSALKPKSFGNEAFTAKRKTDAANGVILRLYEAGGENGEFAIQSSFLFDKVQQVNLMERNGRELSFSKTGVKLPLSANSIETLLINLKSPDIATEKGKPAVKKKPAFVYSRYWQHNEGAAPTGYLPVSVRILGHLNNPENQHVPEVVRQLRVAVTNDYVDSTVTGVVKIETPPGLRAVPAQIQFSVPADSEQFYPVAIILKDVKTESGFVRAAIEYDNRTIFDILPFGLPEKSFGHAAAEQSAGTRPDWQVRQEGDRVIVEIRNPFSQVIDGEVALIGPVETWGLAAGNSYSLVNPSSWRRSFHVAAKGEQTLSFKLSPNGLLSPDETIFWAVAKLSYFGYVDYKAAVGDLEIKE